MRGYWDVNCPVKRDRSDVLATAYLKPGAHDRRGKLGDKHGPRIQDLQSATQFNIGDEIPVLPERGWLLLLR